MHETLARWRMPPSHVSTRGQSCNLTFVYEPSRSLPSFRQAVVLALHGRHHPALREHSFRTASTPFLGLLSPFDGSTTDLPHFADFDFPCWTCVHFFCAPLQNTRTDNQQLYLLTSVIGLILSPDSRYLLHHCTPRQSHLAFSRTVYAPIASRSCLLALLFPSPLAMPWSCGSHPQARARDPHPIIVPLAPRRPEDSDFLLHTPSNVHISSPRAGQFT
ncbi:hypothetical protein C2E23DRAFT_29938 [Lenzites betulinus]|nr:hypothetical protein C2E23DRAFT_29938 [Lenzites betulinus]